MGNLALNPEFQRRAIADAKLAQARNLSRYGSRDGVESLAEGEGFWFVLRTQGQCENWAAAGLMAKNFSVYVPRIWVKERARRGAVREVERPMFSTYIFLKCRPENFSQARNVAGVADFIGAGSPQAMPERFVDEVYRLEAEMATKTGRISLRWPFKAGDRVIVTDGPFAYFRAEVIKAVDDHGRIMALVDIFGRMTPVGFDADQLEMA